MTFDNCKSACNDTFESLFVQSDFAVFYSCLLP